MRDQERAPDTGARSRSRKATPSERREQRATVDSLGEVLDAAARYLEARPRAEAEVRAKLLRLGYRTELVEDAVARLVELRYLDDDAFARSWVDSRDRTSPRGEHALRAELARKGVGRDVIDEVLGERRDDAALRARLQGAEVPVSADQEAAERLLAKRLASVLREPDLRRRRQKAYALLARHGFSPDVCASASRTALAHEEALQAGPDDGES
jgi:SOS response regulatory protein OraA/RecX